MRTKPFIFGLCVGVMLGVVVMLGTREAKEEALNLKISGVVELNSASSQDGLLDNRLFIREPLLLKGPVYLGSSTGDHNDLYKHVGKPVDVLGRIRKLRGSDNVPELVVEKISAAKP